MTPVVLRTIAGAGLVASLLCALTQSGTGSVLPAHETARALLRLESTRIAGLTIYATGLLGIVALLSGVVTSARGAVVSTAAVCAGIATAVFSLHLLDATAVSSAGLGAAFATAVPAGCLVLLWFHRVHVRSAS